MRRTVAHNTRQNVEVLRVKNRLDPEAAKHGWEEEEAAAATGYRDVGVNLRVVSAEARERGVDGHVAEVRACVREGGSAWMRGQQPDGQCRRRRQKAHTHTHTHTHMHARVLVFPSFRVVLLREIRREAGREGGWLEQRGWRGGAGLTTGWRGKGGRVTWPLGQVRLLLLGFARISNDQGHARYVRWRNGRGE
jgi:hypothetical protein